MGTAQSRSPKTPDTSPECSSIVPELCASSKMRKSPGHARGDVVFDYTADFPPAALRTLNQSVGRMKVEQLNKIESAMQRPQMAFVS